MSGLFLDYTFCSYILCKLNNEIYLISHLISKKIVIWKSENTFRKKNSQICKLIKQIKEDEILA